ncbi:threonine-phosphate decarboxylase [Lichenicola sp.]|uniref:threonine-phosphate decarboxylase n=1 Tax=Lichenicola sp. TaxID=2804529 RepID=UPI003B00BE5A
MPTRYSAGRAVRADPPLAHAPLAHDKPAHAQPAHAQLGDTQAGGGRLEAPPPADAPVHGGRLQAARMMFPAAPEPFIDLSTGINPHSYPLEPFSAAALTRLPEPEAEAALLALAAHAYGAGPTMPTGSAPPQPPGQAADPALAGVVAAPGSQILISLLPSVLGCRRAVLLSPTYSEHAASWHASGAGIRHVHDPDALLAEAGAGIALVLCNPNNPDGRRVPHDLLARLARRCGETGGMLVVDEAFADLEPGHMPAASLLPCEGLVVLRSFGKTHGLAGLRLGFMLSNPVTARRMRTLLGPWAVSGPAIEAGLQALGDPAWRTRTGAILAISTCRLDGMLVAAGLTVPGGTRLFRLADAPDARRIFEQLGRAGILVRRFDHQPGWLRFGLPGDEAAWLRLQQALAALA